MAFAPRQFRECLGQFATGGAGGTPRYPDGDKAGITINSFASVSLDPALVLFSVDCEAATHAAFTGKTRHFCINILRREQRALSELFSSPVHDRWDGVAFSDDGHGMPKFEGNIATFSCSRHAIHEGGDHSIIVGQVHAVEIGHTGDPLLYYGGDYARLG